MRNRNGVRFDLVDENWWADALRTLTQSREAFEVDALELCLALRQLASKPRLDYILIIVRTTHLPLTAAYDVAAGLKRCINAGIKIIAFADHANFANILAVSPCSRRCCPPLAGPIDLSVQLQRYNCAQVMENIGLTVDTAASDERKYGSVSFDRKKPHPEVTEWERQVAADIHGAALQMLEECIDRKIVRQSPIFATAAEAVEFGLMDQLTYEEFLGTVDPMINELQWQPHPAIGIYRKQRSKISFHRKKHNKVLIIELRSQILSPLGDDMRHAIETIRIAAEDAELQGVLIIVDQNGGDLGIADRLWCLVTRLRQHVPVVAYVRTAVSAGYCVASAATKVIANPCGMIGSIGTYLIKFRGDALLRRWGISTENVTANSLGSFAGDAPLTAAQQKILHERANIGFQLFMSRIQAGRKLSPDAVMNLASHIYSGSAGVLSGLADAVGSLTHALDELGISESSHTEHHIIRAKRAATPLPPLLSRILRLR